MYRALAAASHSDRLLCPSAPCTPEAALIGAVQADGQVSLLAQPLPVTESFLARAEYPERRLRFASPCLKGGCTQWSSGGCGVMRELAEANPHLHADPAALPPCAIRSACRWHHQDGEKACLVCPLVITDRSDT